MHNNHRYTNTHTHIYICTRSIQADVKLCYNSKSTTRGERGNLHPLSLLYPARFASRHLGEPHLKESGNVRLYMTRYDETGLFLLRSPSFLTWRAVFLQPMCSGARVHRVIDGFRPMHTDCTIEYLIQPVHSDPILTSLAIVSLIGISHYIWCQGKVLFKQNRILSSHTKFINFNNNI